MPNRPTTPYVLVLLLLILTANLAAAQPGLQRTNQQFDILLQRLLQRDESIHHHWLAARLLDQHPELATYAAGRIAGTSSSDPVVSCLVRSLSAGDGTSRLEAAWRCTGSGDAAVLYLESLPASARSAAWNRHLSAFESAARSDSVISHYLNRSVGRPYDRAVLARIRNPRPADVHLVPAGTTLREAADAPYVRLLEHWERALPPTKRSWTLREQWTVQQIVDWHHQARRFDRVFAYMPAFSNATAYPDLDTKLTLFKRLAFAGYYTGYYQQTIEFYRKDLLPFTSDMAYWNPSYLEEHMRVRLDFGTLLYRLGDVPRARDIYIGLYPDRHRFSNLSLRSALLNNLAVAYLNTGQVNEYLNLQLQSLADAREADDAGTQLRILNNLYIFHNRQQDWENAIRYLDQAYALSLESGQLEETVSLLMLFATYARDYLNDPEASLAYLDRADVYRNAEISRFLTDAVDGERATTLERMGRAYEAVAYLSRLADGSKERGDESARIGFVTRIARVWMDAGQWRQATSYVADIQRFDDLGTLDFDTRVEATNLLAEWDARQGNHDLVRTRLEPQVAEIFERLANSADDQTGFIRFEPRYVRTIRVLGDTYLALGLPLEAARLFDAVKTVNQASFTNSNLLKSTLLTEAERVQEVRLSDRMLAVREQMAEAGEEDRIRLQNELLEIRAERNALLRRITEIHDPLKTDMRVVQRRLRRGEVAISLTQLDSTLYRTVISRSSIQVDPIPLDTGLASEIETAATSLRNGPVDLNGLHRLYTIVLQPVLESRNPARLVFVPDGGFHSIPVEVLPTTTPNATASYGSVRYLIEDMAVRYASSLSELGRSESGNLRSDGPLFYGVGISRSATHPTLTPIPFAETEINRIGDRLAQTGDVRIRTGSRATEQTVLREAGASRILHIASHSAVNLRDPLFSVIYLESDSDSTDGSLYAYELFGTDLRNELIVLSSCESGAGRNLSGSGLIGLGRALRYAGAKSLMLNAWEVQDQTAAEIAEWFYTRLEEGMDKDEALRAAKIRFLTERSADPHQWGSFILVGDSRPVIERASIRMWVVGGLLILALFGVLFGYYRMVFRGEA